MKGVKLYIIVVQMLRLFKVPQYKGLKVFDILSLLQLKLTSTGIYLNTIMTKNQIENWFVI